MAVKIRLTRTGARNKASYRVVAADARAPRDGRVVEILGWYDPKLEGTNFELKIDRVQYWLDQGAQPSTTVKSLWKKGKRTAATQETAPVELDVAVEQDQETPEDASSVPVES